MNEEVYNRLIEIIRPFVRDPQQLAEARSETTFLKDLEVSSSRLVDIVLEIEDSFDLEVSDEEADQILSIGAAVQLIETKLAVA